MKTRIVLNICLFAGIACFNNATFAKEVDPVHDGLFVGIGGSYNSIYLTQHSWGKGISNIQTNTGINSTGVAQGTGAPFHNVDNTLAPAIQLGYFKHINGTPNLLGIKFFYQHLAAISTNSNLYIPQLGQITSNTGVTSSLYGYVNADSVQVNTNHELNLLAFVGRSFGNTMFYFGAGPSLFNLQSKNYYSIGYADYNGATINVTGLVTYSSPTIWAWGGAAQLGMTYYINPTWFIDVSYTYALTGNNTVSHQQTFTNSSAIGSTSYTTSGALFTRNTLNLSNQTVMFTLNKVFDL